MAVQWRITSSDTPDLAARRRADRAGSAERLAKKLRQRGSTAPGEILSVRPSLTGKAELVIKLQVRVEPAIAPAFEVEILARMDESGWFKVGQRVQVRYDPADYRRAIVEYAGEDPALGEQFGS
jgi:hypothetical protein